MIGGDKTPLLAPGDLGAALGLLTRLPVPVDGARASARGAAAAWAYPVAGLIVATVAGLVGSTLLWLGLPGALAAAGILVATIMVTGALHEDGLADTADGLWGGWDRARRLEIMKDSRIGAYGVIALICGLLMRWQALALLIDADLLWPALIAAAVISRAAMVLTMGRLPHARSTGLSQSVGRPSGRAMALACGFGGLAALLFGWGGVALVITALIATAAVALIARAKIGGQTGDILGATQQVVEITVLLTLVAQVT